MCLCYAHKRNDVDKCNHNDRRKHKINDKRNPCQTTFSYLFWYKLCYCRLFDNIYP